jgi:hypothetical protein
VIVSVSVQLQPADAAPPAVDYRWDTDTDILTARLRSQRGNTGMSSSVELEGSDGSWLILDVAGGTIDGVEVAVWPDVHKRRALAPPTAEDARVVVPSAGASADPVSALEVEVRLLAESDDAERVIHFRVGAHREVRTVRVGRDLLLDVDPQSRIAGVWLLNVPPFPGT